jgi:hypothetical protein
MKEMVLRIDETGTYLDEEEVPVMTDINGVEIYEGEPYWNIAGEIYSKETIDDMKEFA